MKININYRSNDYWVLTEWAKSLIDAFKRSKKLSNKGTIVNIYIPYSLMPNKSKKDEINIAIFTHNNQDGLFERFARISDFSFCQAPMWEKEIRNLGKNNVDTLPVPPDPYFSCKLNLAWIGHFAVPSRKGLDLFKKVEDLSFVNLIYNDHTFNQKIPKEEPKQIQNYYDMADYILITSSIEGGPMCLVEGLKTGKKVICPLNVGNAELYEEGIISYKKSNWESLKEVLIKLYNQKKKIADIVKDLTWDNYADNLINIICKEFNIEP